MTMEEKKLFLVDRGLAPSVRNMVDAGWPIDMAIDWVYDAATLTGEEFLEKYGV